MTFALDQDYRRLADALAGEFAFEGELGRGGMGVVFRARDLRLDRPVALKVLPPRLGDDADLRARFLREARTAAQLSHPHIVPIFSADERAGFAYFTMALVDGETLGARLGDRGPLPIAEVVRHLREVAWALAYAHARGVIHRDVKPDNILIERGTGRALVTDFGIARNETAAGLTSEGHVVGTAHFMSPEQAQGSAIDGRSDLYALGIVGFALLSGRLPFEGEASPAVLVAQITRPAPPLRSLAPRVPNELAAVIDRCLAKDPAARFATGEALAEALASALIAAEAELPATVSGPQTAISESAAEAVWKRAAQLQAEAAVRLEREARSAAQRALTFDGTDTSGLPTRSYKLRDVEAAAVEAGISQRFVALALSELPAAGALEPATEHATRDRIGTALLGPLQYSLSVAKVIAAPARDVLRSLGQTVQQVPFRMQLKDQLGAHPLDGGILVFRLPDMDAGGVAGYSFTWLRYGLSAVEVRATLRPLEHDRSATEVSLFADLRPGITNEIRVVAGLGVAFSGTAAGVSALVAAKTLALAGAALALPATLSALAVGALGVAVARVQYRYQLKWAKAELEAVLGAVETAIRSRRVFDADPPAQLPRPAAGDDVSWIAGIG